MKHFSEFMVCGGYKADIIKEYFKDFYIYESDITVDLKNNSIKVHKNKMESWKVTLVNTGLNTLTTGRILKIREYIDGDEEFFMTYGVKRKNL